MRTPIEQRLLGLRSFETYHRGCVTTVLAGLLLTVAGCGEPSIRELKNRRELEALLTAISLQNKKELDKDIKRIDDATPRASSPTTVTRASRKSSRRPRPATGAGPRNWPMSFASRSRISSNRRRVVRC